MAGLGGHLAPPKPSYAFHTRYVTTRKGAARFSGRFEGLAGSAGSLRLVVHAQQERGPRVRRIADHVVPFADLVAKDGHWEVPFRARGNHYHALMAEVIGPSDASASSLTVQLDGWGTDARFRSRILAHKLAMRLAQIGARRKATYRAGVIAEGPATLAAVTSQTCTAAQIAEPIYVEWAGKLQEQARLHRKQWELVYILQALTTAGVVRPGAQGIVFGCGREPIPAYLASQGCRVLATDLAVEEQMSGGWIASQQHSSALQDLYFPDLCEKAQFRDNVDFRPVDMNSIPEDLTGFDFCWSACAYEHLGSIKAGLAFVRNSLNCLKPGGVAVHTSELNLSSNRRTIDHDSTVLFRRRDMETLALELRQQGHHVMPMKFDLGQGELDLCIDTPPYAEDTHLKVALRDFVSTSFGLIVIKAS